jgi:hypothetical protein
MVCFLGGEKVGLCSVGCGTAWRVVYVIDKVSYYVQMDEVKLDAWQLYVESRERGYDGFSG